MTEDLLTRARELAVYIIENRATIRQAAKHFGLSKSTVHMEVTVQNVFGGQLREKKTRAGSKSLPARFLHYAAYSISAASRRTAQLSFTQVSERNEKRIRRQLRQDSTGGVNIIIRTFKTEPGCWSV